MQRKLHVVYLLPQPVTKRCIDISEKLTQRYDAFYTLNHTSANPHITQVQVVCDEEVIESARERALELCANVKKVATHFNHTRWIMGWIQLMNPTEGLQELHNTLRDELSTFGEVETLQPYAPHATLTRLKDFENPSVQQDAMALCEQLWAQDTSSFTLTQMAIGFAGPEGTFPEPYTIVNLE